MKTGKKRGLLLVVFLLVGMMATVSLTARETKAEVMKTRKGIEYTAVMHIDKSLGIAVKSTAEFGVWSSSSESDPVINVRPAQYRRWDLTVSNIKTGSRNLSAKLLKQDYSDTAKIDLTAKKNGTYTVSYRVDYKTRKGTKGHVNLSTKVYVYDIQPIKKITLGGKTMERLDEETFFSSAYKGKMKITPTKGYKITGFGCEIDYADYEGYIFGDVDNSSFSRGTSLEGNKKIKNGGYVVLNHMAKGVLDHVPDHLIDPDYEVDETSGRLPGDYSSYEYNLKTAHTEDIIVYFTDPYTHEKNCTYVIDIYTMAKEG